MTVTSKYLRNPATVGSVEIKVMGTLTVAIGWDELTSDPSYSLKNYLNESNPKLSRNQRVDNKLDKGNNYLIKNGYNCHVHGFVKENKFIMVSSKPKQFFHTMPDFKITWHQSQWKDQKEVVEEFVKIFGRHDAFAIICKGKVIRSDYWIDSELSYEITKQATYRPGVSVSDQRRGERRSFYLGTKGLKQSVFYEKPCKDRNKLDIKFKKSKKAIEKVTRFEVRYFGKKVPIATYANYIDTAEINLFEHIKTCLFKREKVLELAKKKKIDSDKVVQFLDLVEKEDLHHARKRFNKNRNFYRTIEPILKQAGVDLNLSKRWQNKVTHKIVADFDIHQYFQELGVSNEKA